MNTQKQMFRKSDRDAKYWREDFEDYANRLTEIMTKPDPVRDLFPSNEANRKYWLDLSVNPIVGIKSAYLGNELFPEYFDGAEVTLQDGTVYRWDGMHGGGGWNLKIPGRMIDMDFRYRMAIDAFNKANGHSKLCIIEAEKKDADQEKIVELWNLCDQQTIRGAEHALIFFLWWMQGE